MESRLRFFLLIVFAMFFRHSGAQVINPPDPSTIEAYIYDHKQQRSLLLARSALEESNALLHKASMKSVGEYKNVNIELEKYTKAFDVIDLVYSTVSTGFQVYRTYDTVTDKLEKYKAMLTEYSDKILLRAKIESADTLLIHVNQKAISNIAEECSGLYKSVAFIAAYSTGMIHCTTATLTLMVQSVSDSLERIRTIINQAYFQTWKFIQLRTRMWKAEVYRSRNIRQMAEDAIGRWLENSKLGKKLDY